MSAQQKDAPRNQRAKKNNKQIYQYKKIVEKTKQIQKKKWNLLVLVLFLSHFF